MWEFEEQRFSSSFEVSAAYEGIDGKRTRINWRNKNGFIKLPEEARLAAFQVSEDVAARMQAAAPKQDNSSPVRRLPSPNRKPGRLKSNIKAFKTDTGGMINWNSKHTANHWAAVEFGAGPHTITGPNGISFLAKGHRGKASVSTGAPRKGKINVPYVNHPGNRAQPYIRPSVEWGKDELWRRVTGRNTAISAQSRGSDVSFVGSSGSVFNKARRSESRGGKKPL